MAVARTSQDSKERQSRSMKNADYDVIWPGKKVGRVWRDYVRARTMTAPTEHLCRD